MTIADWCILAACLMPTLIALIPKLSPPQGGRAYDNADPRGWEAQQSGWKARAVAAHNNGFEALPLFIAAVIIAQQASADQGRIDELALAFIFFRIIYTVFYFANLAALRTPAWFVATACCIAILVMR
jgi:uncharacterized MAPEG superfamily protein